MIETAEGPVRMAETPGKGFAVLTRLPSGRLGFRQLIKVGTVERTPLVRIVLDTGHVAVTAPGHVFYLVGMQPVPAEQLRSGALLETAFRYPEGYWPPDAGTPPVGQAIGVRAVEPGGRGAGARGHRP